MPKRMYLWLLLACLAANPCTGFSISGIGIDNRVTGPLDLALKTFAFMKDLKREPDPDIGKQTPAFIESRGFLAETHYAETKDGYILGIHRIVNPVSKQTKKRPVILHHGLLGSSVDFVENSPGGCVTENPEGKVGNNLGFELAKRGYDVWMPNTRGNWYSYNHTFLDPKKDNQFWDFSIDESIAYDLPAVIDYIRQATNSSKVSYVGHSQGTTIMFGLLSSRPQYSQVIEPCIALAPVATVAHLSTTAHIVAKQHWLIAALAKKGGEFLPDAFLRWLAKRLCTLQQGSAFCAEAIFFFSGGSDSPQLNYTRVPIYTTTESLGTSLKNMIHWAQAVNSGRFAKFDYGEKGNLRAYGTRTPPEYALEHIDSQHMALFSAHNDGLATPRDVQMLRNRLKVKLLEDYVIPYQLWSHIDFIWGLEAGKYVNAKVITILNKYQN